MQFKITDVNSFFFAFSSLKKYTIARAMLYFFALINQKIIKFKTSHFKIHLVLKKISCYLFFLLSFLTFSQSIPYSDNTVISVLTCGPGDDLYSKFGHSAFRIQDFNKHYDVVYNYGVFDHKKPNFYLNFVKGKLYYRLDKVPYNYFYQLYQNENRAVKKQVLNLSLEQRKKLITFLENNAKTENATYQYDFFYNNCATKIRAVLDEVFPNKIVIKDDHITTSFTMRDLINNNVSHNTWSNVGINIALGSVIDVKATTDEYQFLPKYIFEAFNNASIQNTPLIKETSTILAINNSKVDKQGFSILSPYCILSILSLLIIWITFTDFKKNKRNKTLDFILLFITGLTGVFSLLLWFATDHTTTANNLNILWAFAPNLIIAFITLSKKTQKWISNYFKLLIALLIFLMLAWIFKIEAFAYGMTPIFLALGVRYFYLYKYFKSINVQLKE
ncbi:MAG: DUF4105 domain-containing protein [Flavobacteriaceae bacterium]|nr:DUF4105 domain-containing protein [Flavobacteriaceae bacterium]